MAHGEIRMLNGWAFPRKEESELYFPGSTMEVEKKGKTLDNIPEISVPYF